MGAGACPTCAERLLAVIGHVDPVMALQAACRLFFKFLCIDMFLADNKAVSKHCIHVFGVAHNSANVPACLFSSPVVQQFDPTGLQKGIQGDLLSSSSVWSSSMSSGLKCSGMNCTTSEYVCDLKVALGVNRCRNEALTWGLLIHAAASSLSILRSSLPLLSHLAPMKRCGGGSSMLCSASLASDTCCRLLAAW